MLARFSLRHLALCVVALALLGLMPDRGIVAAQDGPIYLHVFNLAPDVPSAWVRVNGELLRQPSTLGGVRLWSIFNMVTTNLPLPAPGLPPDGLPWTGMSGYYEFYPPGELEIVFTATPAEDAEALATYTGVLPAGGYTAVLLASDQDALHVRLLENTPSDDGEEDFSLYHVVNTLPDVAVVALVDGTPASPAILPGQTWSQVYPAGTASQIQIRVDDDEGAILYDESAPSKAFLPRVTYTLSVISYEGERGLVTIARPRFGLMSRSSPDVEPGTATMGRIAGEPDEVERTHALRVSEDAHLTIMVEAAPDSPLDPYLLIVRLPLGEPIAWNDDADPGTGHLTAGLRGLFLPAGRYVIVISGYAYSGRGDYLLSIVAD